MASRFAIVHLPAAPAPTAEQLAQADALDGQAKQCRQAASDSFDRCDTDGFLSQWASGITARLHQREADLLRSGGHGRFDGLYEAATGRRVNAKLIDGKFGPVWLLADDEAAQFGRRFVPWRKGKRSRVQQQLGLEEREEWAPAKAYIAGEGRGLSGCASARVAVRRTDGQEVGTAWLGAGSGTGAHGAAPARVCGHCGATFPREQGSCLCFDNGSE